MILKRSTVIKSVIKAHMTEKCKQPAAFRQVSSESKENQKMTNNAGDIFYLNSSPSLDDSSENRLAINISPSIGGVMTKVMTLCL